MYYIKREAWFSSAKLNAINCRRLMDQNEVIINNIRNIFIEMNKGLSLKKVSTCIVININNF